MAKYTDIVEMENWFAERTARHISLVQKYCKKLGKKFPQFSHVDGEGHDDSKLKEPEKEPYVHISWHYKMQAEGRKYDVSEDIKSKMNEASYHHVTNNKHHPEYYDESAELNQQDRDGIPDNVTDGTKMPDDSIAEMVCDWSAMSEEKGTNTPKEWADRVIGKRFKFTEKLEWVSHSSVAWQSRTHKRWDIR
jgi:hypothetical protein